MKRLILCLILVGVCAPISFGAWDYEITGGLHGDYTLTGTQSLLMTGGGVYQIDARDSSYVEIQDTAPYQFGVGGISLLLLNDNSSMNYYGGETNTMNFSNNATAILQSGSVNYLSSHQDVGWLNGQPVGQHIEIICREVTTLTNTLLEGIWNVDHNNDGQWDTFSINLVNQSGYDLARDNIKITIIPEPITLALLGLGGLILRRRKR